MADKQTHRGRPAGSANIEYADAIEIPAACPVCNSVNLTRVPGSKERRDDYAGTGPTGVAYRGIVRVRKRCECGQNLIVRRYLPAT